MTDQTPAAERFKARVSGQTVWGALPSPARVGEIVELPGLDHTTFRVVGLDGSGLATLVQHPGNGEEWIQCPKCGHDDLQLLETHTAYRDVLLDEEGATAFGWNIADGQCDYRLSCRQCSHVWPFPEGFPLEFHS